MTKNTPICWTLNRKVYLKIIFMSAAKVGENANNILNYYFAKYFYTLAHQTKYLHLALNLSESEKKPITTLPK